MPRRSLALALIVFAVAGCDSAAQLILPARQATPPPAQAPAPLPRPCTTCGGTGSITQSEERRLPATVVTCQLEATGFLGMGGDQIGVVALRNDGDEGGMFSVNIKGQYPGGGEIQHAEQDRVFIRPHDTVTTRMRFRPSAGMESVLCHGVSPIVVQQHTALCPVCAGRGLVP